MAPALSSFARMSQPVNRTRAAASRARVLSTSTPQRTRQNSRAAAINRRFRVRPWPAIAWARPRQPYPSRSHQDLYSTKMMFDENQLPANCREQARENMADLDTPALEREVNDLPVFPNEDLKRTEKELNNWYMKPDAPWGLAVYRTCYDDEAKWQKMREHLESLVRVPVEDNSRDATLLKCHRFVIMDDKTQFDGASPAKVRDYFEQWSKEELEKNWAEQPVTDEMRAYMYGGPGDLDDGQIRFGGARYNVFVVIDDVSLMSLDRIRPGPIFMLVKRDYKPSRPPEEGDEVHPDYEDGWMYDHDEGPNGWIYIESSNYIYYYDPLNDIDVWLEDFMFMYPSNVYGDMGMHLKRSPAFWRDEVAAEKPSVGSDS